MITSSKAGQAPQDWPLLVLGAGRAYCYYQTGVLAYTGRFIPPPDRSRELAELDRRCAGGESISVDALVWEPDGSEARQFMQAVHEFARRAGGLRYHRESRENFPLELLSDWVRAYVPVVRISEQNDASIVQSNYSSQPIRTVLVFANPSGEPSLPQAAREAEQIADILLAAKFAVRLIHRVPSEHEYLEAFDAADLIYYTGHGRIIDGHPAIPLGNQWVPFAATTGLIRRRPRGLFFAACLAEGAMPRYNQLSGWFVSPISRLADRVSDFSMQFVRTLSDGVPVLDAWRSAGIADQAANDIRRFLFQLQAGWM